MVMMSYSKLCTSLSENLMKSEGSIQSFMLPWKQRKRHILPVNQNRPSVYFSLAKLQLVSCNQEGEGSGEVTLLFST